MIKVENFCFICEVRFSGFQIIGVLWNASVFETGSDNWEVSVRKYLSSLIYGPKSFST